MKGILVKPLEWKGRYAYTGIPEYYYALDDKERAWFQAEYKKRILSALAEQGDAPASIAVWVVYADDHDYDRMSQWLVGVYGTEDEAKKAGKTDEDRYVERGNERSRYNLTIEQTTLTLPTSPAASQEGSGE